MNNRDLLLMALRNLSRRKTRSILSIIGVIIGTTAIVVMLSLDLDSRKEIDAKLKVIPIYTSLECVTRNNVNQVTTGQPAKLDDAAFRN